EGLSVDRKSTVFCSGLSVKPNFSLGLVRFDCSGQGAVSARRVYTLEFDSGDPAAMANETPETARTISAELGNDLVSGSLPALGRFRLSILMNPEFGYRFNGTLSRVK